MTTVLRVTGARLILSEERDGRARRPRDARMQVGKNVVQPEAGRQVHDDVLAVMEREGIDDTVLPRSVTGAEQGLDVTARQFTRIPSPLTRNRIH
jgi:hypothetical protein